MQPDEIDRIMGNCPQLISVCSDGNSDSVEVAMYIRNHLKLHGYLIELDPNQLLEKGEKLFKPVRSA